MLASSEVLLALLFVIGSAFIMPRHARCPSGHGWMGDGVRRDGTFACLHNTVIESDAPADTTLVGRIYCNASEIPVVTDERSFACTERKGD